MAHVVTPVDSEAIGEEVQDPHLWRSDVVEGNGVVADTVCTLQTEKVFIIIPHHVAVPALN